MSAANVLAATKWVALTAAINKVKSPNAFLQKLLWGNHQTLPTEDVQLDVITGGRQIAPFVRKNGEAIMVGGVTSNSLVVGCPNIRIKQPFNAGVRAFTRQPGTSIQVGVGESNLSAIEASIARDMQYMGDMVTNAIEYLCAMALQGVISYSVLDDEVITITIPRSAGNSITLSVFWNDATPTLPRPLQNIMTVKQVAADSDGVTITDAICGAEATTALLELVESGNIKMLGYQNNGSVSVGAMTFVSQFTDDGVVYLGELGGVRFWSYARTATLAATGGAGGTGATVSMIRSKWIEFVGVGTSSDRVMYFGAIPDFDASESGLIQAERFSKSWKQPDPSAKIALVHSRPLPWPRKVDATVSMKVVSG